MRTTRQLLEAIFIAEATHPKHAETELNMGQSVARGGRKHTPSTGKMQSDVDSAQSLVKKEAEGGASGLRITGDAATIAALSDALHEASASIQDNDDLAEWCERAWKAAAQGARSGTATLPKFEETPGLDSFNDDQGPGPDEEY